MLTDKTMVECRPQGAEKGSGKSKKEMEGGWNVASKGGEAGIPTGNTKGKERLLKPVPTGGRQE